MIDQHIGQRLLIMMSHHDASRRIAMMHHLGTDECAQEPGSHPNGQKSICTCDLEALPVLQVGVHNLLQAKLIP